MKINKTIVKYYYKYTDSMNIRLMYDYCEFIKWSVKCNDSYM